MNQKIQDNLRAACLKLRTSSIPLSDFIPLLQKAADRIDELESNIQPVGLEHYYKFTQHQRPL